MEDKNSNEQNQTGGRYDARPPQQPSGPYESYEPPHQERAYRDPRTGEPQGWQRSGSSPISRTAGADEERAFSILSYIGILWIVGLLADRENQTVKFHVNQGIILSIFEFALGFALMIAKAIVSAVFISTFVGIPVLSWIGTAINGILSFAGWCLVLVYVLIGALRAAQGRKEPLPLIGDLFTVIR